MLHLVLLVSLTLVGGSILVRQYNWSGLSAYGFVCTIVCQISSVVFKIRDGSLDGMVTDAFEKRQKKQRAERVAGGNPKKKHRKKET